MVLQRGFTLVETIVTVAIIAILLAAGGIWMLGMRPGALAQAADDYDAAVSSARAIAASSGNGTTLVFAPRSNRVAGFELRIYSGRPSLINSVQPTTAMPVVSDAAVSEKTLGAVPFAIFIGASGHVSGKASYPSFDSAGNASFVPIVSEPTCPFGGFVLTFTGPQGATMTRTLPCTAVAASSLPGQPNPSPTPNVPIATPPLLVYHWPADARQHFVATEWGYTHWFATKNAFACGNGVASFPDVLPSPYAPAYTQAEADATPSPPAGTPYSYPNSNGQSMNDAPARFPLDPAGEGLCAATVADDFGQRAHTDVQVMGWLTATYKGNAYTHLSSPSLTLPSSDFPSKGSAVTIALSKTYDAETLAPQVVLDAACSPYVSASVSPGTTPRTPSATPARASLTIELVTMPGSKIVCGGIVFDQYNGSQRGEGVPFNATIQPAPPDIWPPRVHYPTAGNYVFNSAGIRCAANQPIAEDSTGAPLTSSSDPWAGLLSTGADACIKFRGAAVDMNSAPSFAVHETGYSGPFDYSQNVAAPCGTALVFHGSSSGPYGVASFAGTKPKTCQVAMTDTSGDVYAGNTGDIRVSDTLHDSSGNRGYFGHYSDNGTCGGALAGSCYAYSFPIIIQFTLTTAPDIAPVDFVTPAGSVTSQQGTNCHGSLVATVSLYDGPVSSASATTGGVNSNGALRVAQWTAGSGAHSYSTGAKSGVYSLVIDGSGIACAGENWETDYSYSDTITQG
jgi:prepilin-type N-terminal cleavage/methylation domain-containing protein